MATPKGRSGSGTEGRNFLDSRASNSASFDSQQRGTVCYEVNDEIRQMNDIHLWFNFMALSSEISLKRAFDGMIKDLIMW